MVPKLTAQSSVGTAIGVAVAAVAIVGTQVFGWEWGAGQLVPTIIGAVVAAVAVVLVVQGALQD